MDKVDRNIIEMLKQNSRMPFMEMGKKTGLTEGAMRYRVRSLVDRGVIRRFTIETGGEGIKAIICAKTVYKTDMKRIVASLSRIGGVEKIAETSGEYDMIIHVSSHSTEELNRIIDSVRTVNGVVSTVSYLVLQEHGTDRIS